MDTKAATVQPPPPPSSIRRRIIEFDTALSLRLYTLTHSILPYTLLKSLEISGDGRLFFPIIISLILYPFSAAKTAAAPNPFLLNLFIGALLDLLLIGLLKHLIRRPRPVYNKNMFLTFAVDHWSFPSGHSSRVSFIATLFYFHFDWIQNSLMTVKCSQFLVDYFVLIVVAWAAITSVSRILLGRHFVFDVLAGMCLGVLEGLFVFRVCNYENLVSFFR